MPYNAFRLRNGHGPFRGSKLSKNGTEREIQKCKKPRLIRLRVVGTKPSREGRDFRECQERYILKHHILLTALPGVPGGAAPWRLLVPFRRRKGTARPGRGNPPHCMGKTIMRQHCRKNKASPAPSSPPAPARGAIPPGRNCRLKKQIISQ